MPDTLEREPHLLAGRYELGEVLGKGGMGLVYQAWDSVMQCDVAVKVLHQVSMDAVSRARFSAEADTLAGLHHPGLIELHDASTEGDEPYIVMELVEGETLSQRVRAMPMTPRDVSTVGVVLSDTLNYVHGRRIVHRDLKPSNVLLGNDGAVKLADFGVARALDNAVRHTGTGLTMGTAGYLSPEQVRGEEICQASDIYSLGLVLIEALSGRPAFTGDPVAVAVARLINPPRIDVDIPVGLAGLLTAMTANDPDERPLAHEVGAGLREFLNSGAGASALVNQPVNLPAPVLAAGPGLLLSAEPDPTAVAGPITGDVGFSTLLAPPDTSDPVEPMAPAVVHSRHRADAAADPTRGIGMSGGSHAADVSPATGGSATDGSGELPHRRDVRDLERRRPRRMLVGWAAVLAAAALLLALILGFPFGGSGDTGAPVGPADLVSTASPTQQVVSARKKTAAERAQTRAERRAARLRNARGNG